MFTLIVELFVVATVNGAILVTPSEKFAASTSFATEQVCMEYLGSAAGQKMRLAIEAKLAQPGAVATYFCQSRSQGTI